VRASRRTLGVLSSCDFEEILDICHFGRHLGGFFWDRWRNEVSMSVFHYVVEKLSRINQIAVCGSGDLRRSVGSAHRLRGVPSLLRREASWPDPVYTVDRHRGPGAWIDYHVAFLTAS
jgi:hypothetical protein